MERQIYELLLTAPCSDAAAISMLASAFEVSKDKVTRLQDDGPAAVYYELEALTGVCRAKLSVYAQAATAVKLPTDEDLALHLAKATQSTVYHDLPEDHEMAEAPGVWACTRASGETEVVQEDSL